MLDVDEILFWLQVAKVVNRNKSALTYSYRQCLPLTAMAVYLFECACKYNVYCPVQVK